ncbi:methyltransferase domain-containing protein [Acidiphilium multivorum]|uniref:methyltransferase domain-containing protein n=1 Tax=Acidiphilium multivorum TaxID=62140 RepID=UPI0039C8D6BD
MREASKSIMRRLTDSRFATRYFVGEGIDIGSGPDPISFYAELFPLMREVRSWDLADGDAQYLEGVPDASFDFVHSSHCLEHMRDPLVALRNWLRVLKPGGHMVVLVPDEICTNRAFSPRRSTPITNVPSRCTRRRPGVPAR